MNMITGAAVGAGIGLVCFAGSCVQAARNERVPLLLQLPLYIEVTAEAFLGSYGLGSSIVGAVGGMAMAKTAELALSFF